MSMKRKFRVLITLMMIFFALSGMTACTDNGKTENTTVKETTTVADTGYVQITQEEAKKIMDSETDCIILDTRTQDEFDKGHIPDAILIPHDEIASKATEKLPDKNQLILVYCRSGRRSKIAAESLVGLGYTNVKEFGGIIDWQYETVK